MTSQSPLRQRPGMQESTSVMIGTGPRTVNPHYVPRHERHYKEGDSTAKGPGLFALAAAGIVLLLIGWFLASGNQYSHLHRKLANTYHYAAKEWEEKYQKQFKDAVWHASFQGPAKQIPLPRVQQSSKHVRNPEQPKEATKTTLYSYRVDHLLDVLYPNSARQQSGSLKRKRLWRQVLPAFKQGINLTLTVTDLATGRETELHVGSVHFARTHSIAAAGESRCIGQQGLWDEGECLVEEYLHALCYKVRCGPNGHYTLDDSGGGHGCSAASSWSPDTWRRLSRADRLHGSQYLPLTARNATILHVRHAKEPSVLESQMIKDLTPHMDTRIVMHALGLAACFIGVVLLVPAVGFGYPIVKQRVHKWLWRSKEREDLD